MAQISSRVIFWSGRLSEGKAYGGNPRRDTWMVELSLFLKAVGKFGKNLWRYATDSFFLPLQVMTLIKRKGAEELAMATRKLSITWLSKSNEPHEIRHL